LAYVEKKEKRNKEKGRERRAERGLEEILRSVRLDKKQLPARVALGHKKKSLVLPNKEGRFRLGKIISAKRRELRGEEGAALLRRGGTQSPSPKGGELSPG